MELEILKGSIESLVSEGQRYEREIGSLNSRRRQFIQEAKFAKTADAYEALEIEVQRLDSEIKSMEIIKGCIKVEIAKKMAIRDKVCYWCLLRDINRGAKTKVVDGMPVCQAHLKEFNKSKMKIPPTITTDLPYSKPGNLSDYLGE